jgi:hypothetical protein
MRQQGKFISLNLAPATTMPFVMPNQIDWTLKHRGPARHLHRILHNIDFHQGAGRDQVGHGVIVGADHSVAVTVGIKIFVQRRRKDCHQILRIQSQKTRLLIFESRVAVELKGEAGFMDFKLGIEAQIGSILIYVLPYLIAINSKRQQKLF